MRKLLLLAFLGSAIYSQAQSGLTLYNFNGVPQSLHMNPGYDQQARLWIALPAISGLSVGYHNSAFTPADILKPGTDVNENIDNVILNLDDQSQLAFRQEIDLLGVGFRTEVGFFTVGSRFINDYVMEYPRDLMILARFGNTSEGLSDANLSDYDQEVTTRVDYYVGWQNTFMEDRLSVGVRAKYIFGLANGYTERTDLSIVSQDDSRLVVQSDIIYRTAGVASFLDNTTDIDIPSTIFPENRGFAFDIGGSYKLTDKISVSGSLLDIGSITWKSNTRDFVSNGEVEFDGANADLSADEPIGDLADLQDSIFSAFDFEEVDGTTYTRSLSPRFFVGGTYDFNEKHAVGVLMQSRIIEGVMFNNYSANYVGRVTRAFQYTVSYSIINNTFNNVGAGFSARLGPVQLYVITDNALHMIFPAQLQSTNIRLGLNLTFFDKKEKKPKSAPIEPTPTNN